MVDECNKQGCSPSALIRTAIMEKIKSTPQMLSHPTQPPTLVEEQKTSSNLAEVQKRPETEVEKFLRLLRESAKTTKQMPGKSAQNTT